MHNKFHYYILLNFYYIASSFVSLKKYDDSNDDRISDDVANSINKQDLASEGDE
mgnify:CR=1 FL=1